MKIQNHLFFLSHLNVYLQHRRRVLCVTILTLLYPTFSLANPNGAHVIGGQVSIDQSISGVTTIKNSPNAIINWQDFNIAQNEITRFIQQNGQSAVLNRIIGGNPSEILGSLFSNGKVFLINPNGIIFGAGSQIDTQGLIASSLNLSNSDFQKGNFHFITGSKAGDISNEGIIHAGKDGNIVLIAPNIENKGIIRSESGKIVLAAGQELILTSLDDPDIRFQVKAPQNHILNVGQLLTEGGSINVFAGSITHSGDISADSVEIDKQGNIRLVAKGDVTLEKDSKISANNEKGVAGKIEVIGENVAVLDNSKFNASGEKGGGDILIGGDYQGKNLAVQNAKTTTISEKVEIKADAKTEGKGGKVIVWSDETTKVHGKISATGGAKSGDGGFVETSGHKLDVNGIKVDTSAPEGKAGEWLLDPYDVSIDASTTGGGILDTNNSFTSSANSSIISAQIISTALENNNVTISTGGSGSAIDVPSGDINVYTSIAKTAGSNTSLTLNAHNSIMFSEGGISSTFGKLDVVLNADSDSSGAGNIQFYSGSIITNGGKIFLGGRSCTTISCDLAAIGTTSSSNGVYASSTTLNSGGGSIRIKGNGLSGSGISNAYGVYFNAVTIDGGAGDVSIDGVGGNGTLDSAAQTAPIGGDSNKGVYLTGSTSISTTTGAINISGTGNGSGTGNYGLLIDGTAIASTSGAITLKGTGVNSAAGLLVDNGTTIGAGTTTGNITLISDSIDLSTGATNPIIQSTGDLILQPSTMNGTIGLAGGAGDFNLDTTELGYFSGFSNIIIGSGVGTGKIDVGSTGWSVPNTANLTLQNAGIGSNGITLNQPINLAATKSLTLKTTGLELLGTESYALTSSSNSVGTLAASIGGIDYPNASLDFVNSGALKIGRVNNTAGITATGTISVATNTRNLTVENDIKTTNTSSSAIVLNAGKSIAAGTVAGGEIGFSDPLPAITTASNGRVTFYSGNATNSSVASYVPIGNFRYNSASNSPNYTTTLAASGNYAIYRQQPAISIAANSVSKTYDGTAYTGVNTATISGDFKNGDTAAVLTGTISYGGNWVNAINAGSYSIIPSGLTNGLGYAMSFVAGYLAINPVQISVQPTPTFGVKADDKTRAYGNANPAFTYSIISGALVGSDSPESIGLMMTTSATITSPVGNYSIIPSITSPNYIFSAVNGTLSITPRLLNINADTMSKSYGATDPSLTYSTLGLLNGDTLTGGLSRATGENVGRYKITSTLTNPNYSVSYTPADFSITQAALNIIANAASKVYGTSDPALTYSTSGLMGSDGLSGSLFRVPGENVGTYAIASTLNNPNYVVSYTPADFTITATTLALAITSDNATRIYGAINPTFTGRITTGALQNGDTFASIGLSFSTPATQASNVGNYPIIPTISNQNYIFTGNNGLLSITPASLSIAASAASKTYGATDPQLTYTANGLITGDSLTGGLTRTSGEDVGSYAIASTLDNSNYLISYTPADFTITAAALELVIAANNSTRVYGTVNPAFTGKITAGSLQNRDTLESIGLLFSTTATETSTVGSYPITPTISNKNYVFSGSNGLLSIMPASLTIKADSQSKTYGELDPKLTYTVDGLVNGDKLTGGLNRETGEMVKIYAITNGFEKNDNYIINYVSNFLTINRATKIEWIGGTANNAWVNATNWNQGVVPNEIQDVIISKTENVIDISGNQTINSLFSLNSLHLANNSSITINNPFTLQIDTTLSGNGAFKTATFTNEGIISPGNSPGKIAIDGDFVQSNTGLLDIQIAGDTEGLYDQLDVSGAVQLGGTIKLSLIDNYALKNSSAKFDFIKTNSAISGSFAQIDTSASPSLNYRFNIVNGKLEAIAQVNTPLVTMINELLPNSLPEEIKKIENGIFAGSTAILTLLPIATEINSSSTSPKSKDEKESSDISVVANATTAKTNKLLGQCK